MSGMRFWVEPTGSWTWCCMVCRKGKTRRRQTERAEQSKERYGSESKGSTIWEKHKTQVKPAQPNKAHRRRCARMAKEPDPGRRLDPVQVQHNPRAGKIRSRR